MTTSPQPRKRTMRLLLISLGVLALLAATAVAAYAVLGNGDEPDLATTAPDLPTPVLTPATATATSTAPAIATPGEASPTETARPVEPAEATPAAPPTETPAPQGPSVSTFVIDPAQSSSIFVVETKVLGFESSEVVTGDGVSGELHVSPQGLDPASISQFQLDMRSLTSDSALLRTFLSAGAFDTANYPYAEFVAASSSEFPPAYGTGEEFSIELTGTLTLNGVSRPVTLQVLARQAGDFLSATADTYIDLSDFNVEVPDTPLGGADDTVRVQVVMVASLS